MTNHLEFPPFHLLQPDEYASLQASVYRLALDLDVYKQSTKNAVAKVDMYKMRYKKEEALRDSCQIANKYLRIERDALKDELGMRRRSALIPAPRPEEEDDERDPAYD